MDITIYNGADIGHGWNPTTPLLQRNELSLHFLARELVAQGHDVTVFCSCDKPGDYDGVEYVEDDRFVRYTAMYSPDVLVAYNCVDSTPFRIPSLEAGLCVEFATYPRSAQVDAAVRAKVDLWLGLSQAQLDVLRTQYTIPPVAMEKTGLGLCGELPDYVPYDQRENYVIWKGAPQNGLHHFLRIHGCLRESFPDLEAHIYCDFAQAFEAYRHDAFWAGNSIRQAKLLLDGPGVKLFEGTSVQQQIAATARAKAMLYPYDPQDFAEVYGMGVMEAKLTGTPCIAYDRDGLAEMCGEDAGPVCYADDSVWTEILRYGSVHPDPPCIDSRYWWPSIAKTLLQTFKDYGSIAPQLRDARTLIAQGAVKAAMRRLPDDNAISERWRNYYRGGL